MAAPSRVKVPSSVRSRTRTEAKLLDAAAELFSQLGYDGTSVKRIAEKSGANVSLINRYFGGKEGLLLTLVERLIVQKQQGDLGYPPQPSLEEELCEYLKYRLVVDTGNDQLIRILVSQIALNERFRKSVLQAFSSRTDENFRERLLDLRARGEIPPSLDIDRVFHAVSYLSFSAGFLGKIVMKRSTKELHSLFEDFSNAYAVGLTSQCSTNEDNQSRP